MTCQAHAAVAVLLVLVDTAHARRLLWESINNCRTCRRMKETT